MYEQHKHLRSKNEISNDDAKNWKGDFGQNIDYGETSFEILDESKVNNILSSKEEFFTKINITSEKYKLIIAACCEVAKVNSEIHIFLNIPFKEKDKYILIFLIYLKMGLPTDITKLLCFTMKSGQIIITRNNLINGEKISITEDVHYKPKNTFMFNFVSEKFEVYDLKIDSHMYLDFAWDNLNFNEKLNRFRSMAQILVTDKFMLDEYDKMCTLFSINENRKFLNESERIEVLKYIYNSIINTKDLIKNKYYCELFVNIFKVEFKNKNTKRQEYLPSNQIIEVILNFYDLIESYFDEVEEEDVKKIINAYILLSIVDGKEKGKLVYISNIFSNANTKILMFRNLIDNMFVHEQFVDEILRWYILKRFAETVNLHELLEEIRFWGKISTKVIDTDFFVEHIENKLLNMLREEYNKLPVCRKIYNFLDDFQNLCTIEEDKYKYMKFTEKVRKSIYVYMIEVINLAKITYKDLMSIDLKNINKENDKYKSIYYMQKLLKGNVDVDIRKIEIYICSLDKYIMLNLTHLVQQYYKENITQENFRTIMVGFVEQIVYVNNIVLYNFYDLFEFIYYNNGIQGFSEYIAWIADNFKEIKESILLSRFKSDLWLYLEQCDKDCFKNKAANKIFSQIKNEDIKKILQDIKINLSGGLKGIVLKLSRPHNKYD